MADFGNITITEKGTEALAYAQKGETLTITKIALGDGRLPEGTSPAQATALYGPKSEVVPQVYDVIDPKAMGIDERFSVLKIGGVYNNQENLEGFDWREYGIFAETESTGEVLYAYGNAGDHAEWIPPGEEGYLVERALDFYVVISPEAHVALSIDSKYFVTEERLQSQITSLKEWVANTAKAHEAATADKLAEARNITVNLESEDPAAFDGSAEANPGVTGVLPLKHGGLGASTAEEARKNLGLEKAAAVATGETDGLMSHEDKAKLDTLHNADLSKLDDITSGTASQIVLADGTVKDAAAWLTDNIETIRTALGVVTKETDGLVPKLPENPEVE